MSLIALILIILLILLLLGYFVQAPMDWYDRCVYGLVAAAIGAYAWLWRRVWR